jgi:spermidine/putrescine transport system permease protein
MLHSRPSVQRIAQPQLLLAACGICALLVGLPALIGALKSVATFTPDFALSAQAYRDLVRGDRLAEFRIVIVRAAIVTAIAMTLAIPSAYWLAGIRSSSRRTIVFSILVAPWFVSDMLRAFGWQVLLSPAGPISLLWEHLFNQGPLYGLRYNHAAAILGIISSVLPVGILCVYAALPARESNEWLAAKEIGAPRHVFRLIAIRWGYNGIAIASGAVFMLSCYASAEPRYLDGPTQSSITTIAASLVNEGIAALLAFSTVLLLFMLFIGGCVVLALRTFAHLRHTGRHGKPAIPQPTAGSASGPRSLGKLLDCIVVVTPRLTGAIAIVLCCAPPIAVMVEAFRTPMGGGQWTLDNFGLMMSSESLRVALLNSAVLALGVGVVTLTLAFVLGLVVWNDSHKGAVLLLLAALIIMPGDAYAIGLIQLMRSFHDQAEGGWPLLLISHTLWALPIATASVVLANRRLNVQILESALEYSRSPKEVLYRYLIPINRNRLIGVGLIGATLSLNESVRTSYLSGGLLTIGNEVHGRLNAGMLAQNRGIFAVEFLVFLMSAVTLILLARTRGLDPAAD